MFERMARILRRYDFARRIYRLLKGIDSTYSVSQTTPINIRRSEHEFKRLNLVIPSINREHFFGGASTALNLFETLVDIGGEDVRSRIILTDAAPEKSDHERFPKYCLVDAEKDSDERHQMLSAVNKFQRNIYVCPEDRFLTTSWWTAYCVIESVKKQISMYGENCNRMGYLIQDYEPGFYNWSTHYAMAESTYCADINTIPIFNSLFLETFFKDRGYLFERKYSFEPRLNSALREKMRSVGQSSRDKKILVYGRPSVSRNCFTLIVEALKIWVETQSDPIEWEVISVGENHRPVPLGKGVFIQSLGKLSLEGYAELLSQSAIGISLMISPHPSYPPLEMSHFGILTLTNSFANKDLSGYHDNITSLSHLTPMKLSHALQTQVDRFSKNPQAGTQGKSMMAAYMSDTEMFPFKNELYHSLFD